MTDQQNSCYKYVREKCNTETVLDFNKVYNYQILKFINNV